MDFAAEPVMDVTPPHRAAARPAQADDGPSFDKHLKQANETAEREAPRAAQTDEPKSNTGQETKPEAPQGEELNAETSAQVVLAAAPPVAPPVAAPLVVQIAASSPAPQQQQQPLQATPVDAAAPAAPAPSSAPVQPTLGRATAPDAAPAAPDSTKSAAAPEQESPANTRAGTAQQANAAPAAGPTTPQQPTPQTPVEVQQLPPDVRAALAATIAPAPEMTQQAAPRAPKAGADAVRANAPETAHAKDAAPLAPNAGANTQPNKAAVIPSAAKDVAAALPAPAATSDAAQSMQTSATAGATTQASTNTQHAAADTGAQRAAPAALQVAREIIRRFDGGNTNFELRLDPPELGRVDVRMEVTRDHRVTAVITADSPQALTELARHARDLEQQLESAGLQLSDNGLSFDLRQGAQGGEKQDASAAAGGAGEDATPEQTQAQTARPIGFERWRGVRVDMMV
jgi:flagellar hook-length control protein FliK